MNIQSSQDSKNNRFTFRHWFRLVFTVFSLYLLGDVFYRWDAFKFHSSFSDYVPNVALAFIIWSIVALLCSIITWLLMKVFELVCRFLGLKIKAEHLILYLCLFIIIAALAWVGKKVIWKELQTSAQIKLTVIVFISCAAVPAAWLFRGRAALWMNAIQEHITPLIWLFTICLMLSLPLVGYHMLEGTTGNNMSKSITKPNPAGADKKQPNILLVTFDAFAAGNMSLYGYGRDTTPFMKKWAENASLFTRTKAGSSYTAATVPGIITGKRTWTHRKYHHDIAAKPRKSETENIALLLKENGYHTSAFIANSVVQVNALGITGSLDYAPLYIELSSPVSIEGLIDRYLYLLFGDKFSTYNWLGQDDFIFVIALHRIDKSVHTTELPPELAFNKFLKMMDNNAHEPFFAWIHVMVPHGPYLPPNPFAGTFNSSRELREKNEMISINPEIVKYKDLKLFPDFPEELLKKIRLLSDYYDEFILYCDKQFETFIGELQKRKWMNNTVIIVSADHGESFYQHNYFQHGPPHLFEQVTHIPLIIKGTGQSKGKIISDLVEQVDIPATILDFADIPVPSWMEGRSLRPLLRDEKLPAKTAIAVSLYNNVPTEPITKGSVAVWQDDYKLVYYLESKTSLLFNLNRDPDELDNLFTKEPDTAERLMAVIKSNLSVVNRKIKEEK